MSQAPELRSHVEEAVRRGLDSGDPSALAMLLVEWPLAHLRAEVCQRLADGACDKETAVVLGKAAKVMAQRVKSSPKTETRALRDEVDRRLADYRRMGEEHDLKFVLAEVDPEFVTKERRSYRRYQQGSRAPQIWINFVGCPEHDAAKGVRPAPNRSAAGERR